MVLSTDPWAALWSALHGVCPSSRMGCSIVDWPNCYELGTLTFSELEIVARWVKSCHPSLNRIRLLQIGTDLFAGTGANRQGIQSGTPFCSCLV